MTKKHLVTAFSVLVAVTLALRLFLQLSEIDQYYGFYYSNPVSDAWGLGFLALLLLGTAGIAYVVWRIKPADAPPALLQNRLLALCQIALGLIAEVGAYLTGFNVMMAIFGGYRVSIADAAISGLTILAGLVLIVLGLSTLSGKNAGSLFSAIVVVAFMALTLVTTFMYYPIVFNVSDNMLHILTLTAATAFFMYYFKVLVGVGSQKDTVLTAVLGLLTAYFAVTLVIPRWFIIATQGINAFVPSVSKDDLLMAAALGLTGLIAALSLLQSAPAATAPAPVEDAGQEDGNAAI